MYKVNFSDTVEATSVNEATEVLQIVNLLNRIGSSKVLSASWSKHNDERSIMLQTSEWPSIYKFICNCLPEEPPPIEISYQDYSDGCGFWRLGFTFRGCEIFCLGDPDEFAELGVTIDG